MPVPTFQAGYRLVSGDDLNNGFSTFAGGSGYSQANNLIAHAGGGQASATPVTAALNRFTTVATAGDSVALPLATGGQSITVINAGAASMQVFASAAGADTINGAAGATGIALASGKTMEFVSFPGAWHGLLSA